MPFVYDQLIEAQFEHVSVLPASGKTGQPVYLTADNKVYVWNGTAWETGSSGEIQNGSITTVKLADGAVTNAKVTGISGAKITSGTIPDIRIPSTIARDSELSYKGDWVPGNYKLGNYVMHNGNFYVCRVARNSTHTDTPDIDTTGWGQIDGGGTSGGLTEIPDGAVTERKLATDAVTQSKIKDDSVGSRELIASSVSSVHIINNTIQSGDIQRNAIIEDKIDDDAVTTSKIAANAVTDVEVSAAIRNQLRALPVHAFLSQSAYDALSPKVSTTLYFITS